MKIALSPEAQTPMRERFTKLAETGVTLTGGTPAVKADDGTVIEPAVEGKVEIVTPGSFCETYGLTPEKVRRLATMRYDNLPELTRAEVRAIEAELSVYANSVAADEELYAVLFDDLVKLRAELA